MSRALLSVALHVYGTGAVLYLVYLIRPWRPLYLAGRTLVGSAFGFHAVALGLMVRELGGVATGLVHGLVLFALMLVAIFLFLDVRYKKPVLGAFLTPAALAVLVPALLIHTGVEPLGPAIRRPLLPVHVTIAVLGVAAFAVAAGVAVMYLLLERQMKGKKFGLLFSRLPSLQFLDQLNHRLIVGGFIALSVTVVTGAFFAPGVAEFFSSLGHAKQLGTLVAWAMFGALLNARLFAGWQGRRVALLTMAGFCVLLFSFLSAYDVTAAAGGMR